MNKSKFFWNNVTLVDLSKRPRKEPSAPALTASPTDRSTHPPKEVSTLFEVELDELLFEVEEFDELL